MIRKTLMSAGALALALSAGAASAATNLVQDGGFEARFDQGELSPWDGNWSISSNAGSAARTGVGASGTGCVGAVCVDPEAAGRKFLTQTINGLTVGQVYTLSFYLATPASESNTPNAVRVFWDGLNIGNVVDLNTPDYQLFSFDLTATAVSQTLTFLGRNDPATTLMDDVSLVARDATAAVPEPASWALMLLGFGGLGAALRRRRAMSFA